MAIRFSRCARRSPKRGANRSWSIPRAGRFARHPGACLDVTGWLPETSWINRRFGPAASTLTTATFVLGLLPRLFSIRRQKDALIYTRDLRIASVISACFPSLRRRLFVECHSVSVSARRRAVQLRILKRCAGVVCMTGAMQNRFVEMGIPVEHTLVATDAVDLETFVADIGRPDARAMLGLDPDATIAAFIGRFHTMEMEKGIPGVIEAARYLVAGRPGLRFAFIGGPLDRVAAYRAQIERLGLPADRFLFFDKQPVTDIPKWLAAADMLLMPFPWTEHYAYYASSQRYWNTAAMRCLFRRTTPRRWRTLSAA